MAYASNPYDAPTFSIAAVAAEDERASFIGRTYLHLVAAVAALIALEFVLLQTPLAQPIVGLMVASRYSWLIVLALFMGVNWIANRWASSATSLTKQYAGLGLYVVAQAVILLPMLYIATTIPAYSGIVTAAAFSTLGLFMILTAVVLIKPRAVSFFGWVVLFCGF
jgi:hypothetical protein